jgi:hypothetical protein
MADEQRQMLDVYLQEYGKLKDEQVRRINNFDPNRRITVSKSLVKLPLTFSQQIPNFPLQALI